MDIKHCILQLVYTLNLFHRNLGDCEMMKLVDSTDSIKISLCPLAKIEEFLARLSSPIFHFSHTLK